MRLAGPGDDGTREFYLYLVDLATGDARRLEVGPVNPSSALWSRDDTQIVTIVGRPMSERIVALDAANGALLGQPATVPPGFFVIATG